MDYLNRILGIQVVYLQEEPCFLPNYLAERYSLKRVMLDNIKAIFIYPRQQLDSVNTIKKHMKKLKKQKERGLFWPWIV